jgi:diaminohydroxyphosphoribosylaminopyrimidine deaminase/5-amino-6-(5-phosphoribosylamino)uracil reductase
MSSRRRPTQRRSSDLDQRFMRRAIELARRGRTHPNPRVGAVVVRAGRVVGEGYHRRCGAPHAEAVALRRAGERARGGTLYVTLEPCNHQGRTPPCAPQVVEAGIRRVVVARRDPDPRTRGSGLRLLRRAAIGVEVGLLAGEARELNEAYDLYHRLGRPLTVLKLATTLDGRLALADGGSQWITGKAARRAAHALRAAADCVLVGAETVRCDDPSLTVRHLRGANPERAVVSGSLKIPLDSTLFVDGAAPTVVLTGRQQARGRRALELARRGVEVLAVRRRGSRLDLGHALELLAERRGVRALLVEGGGRLAGQLIARGLVAGCGRCWSRAAAGWPAS